MGFALEMTNILPGTFRENGNIRLAYLAIEFMFVVLRVEWASDKCAGPLDSFKIGLLHYLAGASWKTATFPGWTRSGGLVSIGSYSVEQKPGLGTWCIDDGPGVKDESWPGGLGGGMMLSSLPVLCELMTNSSSELRAPLVYPSVPTSLSCPSDPGLSACLRKQLIRCLPGPCAVPWERTPTRIASSSIFFIWCKEEVMVSVETARKMECTCP